MLFNKKFLAFFLGVMIEGNYFLDYLCETFTLKLCFIMLSLGFIFDIMNAFVNDRWQEGIVFWTSQVDQKVAGAASSTLSRNSQVDLEMTMIRKRETTSLGRNFLQR